jgi:hypothetical protein
MQLDVYVPLQYSLRPPSLCTTVTAGADASNMHLATLMDALLQGTPENIASCFGTTGGKNSRVIKIEAPAGAGKSLFGWRCMQVFDEGSLQRPRGKAAIRRIPV